MITDINSEDRLVQETFAAHLRDKLGWDSVYASNDETFGPGGALGRDSERDTVLVRDLAEAIRRLNPGLPAAAVEGGLGTRLGDQGLGTDNLFSPRRGQTSVSPARERRRGFARRSPRMGGTASKTGVGKRRPYERAWDEPPGDRPQSHCA